MAADSPFGGVVRGKIIKGYFQGKEVAAATAWEHVYRLLLSIERRTQLAHVMDANHMQPGGNFYSRAVRFTELLCKRWQVGVTELPEHIDLMFRACVEAYLATKPPRVVKAVQQALAVVGTSDAEEPDDDRSEFLIEIADLLAERLPDEDPKRLADIAAEIEEKAEHYFTIEKKRQNVRGEGFEDTLEWLLQNVSGLSRGQVRVRKRVNELPGFKPELPAKGKARDKVPKPDIAITLPDGKLTLWLVTAKWSLRQDRLDQFGQEAAFYKAHKIQDPTIDFVLVTNEMDIARLRGVLAPPEGEGGFHFSRVYHVNCELLAETQQERFKPLEVFRTEGRLLSLEDLLVHAAKLSAASLSPQTPRTA